MKLPIDIPAVLKAATDIEGAAKTPLSVSVLIDDSAPGDVVGHVRAAFASAGTHTRVTISYIDDRPVVPYEADDMAVIIAGYADNIGEQAQRLREAGIPVMVATTLPTLVHDTALTFGHPIPDGDIVAPSLPTATEDKLTAMREQQPDGSFEAEVAEAAQSAKVHVAQVAESVVNSAKRSADVVASAADSWGIHLPFDVSTNDQSVASTREEDEPIVLDDVTRTSLDERMGQWIIAACRDKKLAFALAFPFVRKPLSIDSVNATSLQNAGVGLVMFIPGADMPIMTLNQAKMLLQIAAAYGQPLGVERVKELALVVGGAFICRNIARSAAGVVPVLGWAIRASVGFAGTEAIGRAAIEYFEAGGDIVGMASVVQKARDEAVSTASKAAATPAGQKFVSSAKDIAGSVWSAVKNKG